MTDWAYAAGFLDGEGCISIGKQGGKALVLKVDLGQQDKRPLDWLVSLFGGNISYHKPRPSSPNGSFVWALTAGPAQAFLRGVLPYLRVKREAAELAIAFQDTKVYGAGGRVPADVAEHRASLAQSIREHNHRFRIVA